MSIMPSQGWKSKTFQSPVGETCCSETLTVGDDEAEAEAEDKEHWAGWLTGWHVGCCNASTGKRIANS